MNAARWTAADLAAIGKRVPLASVLVDRPRLASIADRRPRPAMNKLETAYAQRLELERHAGLWLWWAFEPITLRLAKGARYTPDFALLDPGGHLLLHETKGFWREAARIRIKVAAEMYPFFRFVAVTRPKGGNWTLERF